MPRKPVSSKPGKGFGDGRHIGRCRRALQPRDRQRTQLAVLQILIRGGRIHEQAIDFTADQIRHRICDRAIGHALQPLPGEPAELFPRHARGGIEVAEGDFAGRGLSGGDQAGTVAPGRLRPHHQIAPVGTEHADQVKSLSGS